MKTDRNVYVESYVYALHTYIDIYIYVCVCVDVYCIALSLILAGLNSCALQIGCDRFLLAATAVAFAFLKA